MAIETKAPGFTPEFGKDGPVPEHGRLDGAAFHSNHEPIRAAICDQLAARTGHVIEVGSGTGQHVVNFAKALPDLTWWPSDHIQRHINSVDGWQQFEDRANVRPGFILNAGAADWGLGQPGRPPADGLAAILAINLFHIAPYDVALGVLAAGGRHLAADGVVIVYGPFCHDGEWTTDRNVAFDASLRAENPDWGVRDTADLNATARDHGLDLDRIVDMPKNNCLLYFARQP